jgi:hypothetical protein
MGFLFNWRANRDVNDFTAIHLNVGDVLHRMSVVVGREVLGQSRVP